MSGFLFACKQETVLRCGDINMSEDQQVCRNKRTVRYVELAMKNYMEIIWGS